MTSDSRAEKDLRLQATTSAEAGSDAHFRPVEVGSGAEVLVEDVGETGAGVGWGSPG